VRRQPRIEATKITSTEKYENDEASKWKNELVNEMSGIAEDWAKNLLQEIK
jgi:ERCC4-type nuclease